MTDVLLFAGYIGFLAFCTFYTLLVLLPRFMRWLLLPERPIETEAPEGSAAYQMTQMDMALYEARSALGDALLPIVEETVRKLAKVLR